MKQGKCFGLGYAFQTQPPSGGCVLKPDEIKLGMSEKEPAAFGRLCVETSRKTLKKN